MKNVFLFLLSLGFTSCITDKVDPNKKELLVQHPWRLTEVRHVRLGQPDLIMDISCAINDKWNINKDGTYKWTLSNDCNTENQPDLYGTWRIEGNNFYLTDMYPQNSIPVANREDDYQIKELTESTFILIDTIGTGGIFTEINTYKKF